MRYSLSRRSFVAASAILPLFSRLAVAAERRPQIGVTLHPYYSFVSNIVGDAADVVPLIPAGFNPHAYEPRAEDIRRLGTLDVVVLNGIGHDDFAERMIAASDRPLMPTIEANRDVPLLAAVGGASSRMGNSRMVAGQVVNSHTFLSITGAIQQIQTIARELAGLDPDNAATYTKNARAYAQRLRKIKAAALSELKTMPGNSFRVATIHGAYDYLLREFGLDVTAVVEPAHGIEPSPSQLAKTIDAIKALDVKVIFSELDFPAPYVETIERETGIRLYPLSHIIYGEYTPEKFEVEIARNFATVVRAIREQSGQQDGVVR
jgi:zinc transport system substrate-binding protein